MSRVFKEPGLNEWHNPWPDECQRCGFPWSAHKGKHVAKRRRRLRCPG